MNKILLGVILGAILGAIDGATAWFTPEVRPAIVGIIIGGAIKSIIAGALLEPPPRTVCRWMRISHWPTYRDLLFKRACRKESFWADFDSEPWL